MSIERAQKRCLKLLHLLFSTSIQSGIKLKKTRDVSRSIAVHIQRAGQTHKIGIIRYRSGLERLDCRHDVITQKMFQEIKDQNIPCIICCHMLKCTSTKQKFQLWTTLHPI